MHPTEYKCKDGKFIGYAFAEGPSPAIYIDNDLEMFIQLISYLQDNNLVDQVAFQVGHFNTDGGPTVEIEVVDRGIVTLPASMVNADKTVPTGYNVKLYINQLPEGEPPPLARAGLRRPTACTRCSSTSLPVLDLVSLWMLCARMVPSRQSSCAHFYAGVLWECGFSHVSWHNGLQVREHSFLQVDIRTTAQSFSGRA